MDNSPADRQVKYYITMDTKILKYLYSKKNDGTFYDVSTLFKSDINKHSIDMCVVELEKNGYVIKRVEGYLHESAIPPGEDKTDANNSICKILPKGIDYYENFDKNKTTRRIALGALFISILGILLHALQYYSATKH